MRLAPDRLRQRLLPHTGIAHARHGLRRRRRGRPRGRRRGLCRRVAQQPHEVAHALPAGLGLHGHRGPQLAEHLQPPRNHGGRHEVRLGQDEDDALARLLGPGLQRLAAAAYGVPGVQHLEQDVALLQHPLQHVFLGLVHVRRALRPALRIPGQGRLLCLRLSLLLGLARRVLRLLLALRQLLLALILLALELLQHLGLERPRVRDAGVPVAALLHAQPLRLLPHAALVLPDPLLDVVLEAQLRPLALPVAQQLHGCELAVPERLPLARN
mmetsp:Transcript_125740/g.367434  ORF Transcript_125740/g.367434 Transcript_125740/m.367434 type:complete len:270 (+) Transcript_125740:757-1566(+)